MASADGDPAEMKSFFGFGWSLNVVCGEGASPIRT